MNFIGRHIRLLGLVLLAGFAGAAAAIYCNVPQRIEDARRGNLATPRYVCPMHAEVRQSAPGRCGKCGMALVAQAPASVDPGAPAAQAGGCCKDHNAPGADSTMELTCPHLTGRTNSTPSCPTQQR